MKFTVQQLAGRLGLAFEGDGEVYWYEGDYQGYAADYHRRKGASADQPHRIRYKKLVH